MSKRSPFLESIRKEIRLRGYSMRTEKTYLNWLRHQRTACPLRAA